MNLKQLINKSIYGTIGYISSQDDLDLLEQYVVYNLPVLKEFKQIVVATNFGSPLQKENTQLWKKYFPDCIIIDSKTNRGHNFGTADLDNLVFDWCKQNNEEWLCKSGNDMIFQIQILDIEIDDADFYHLNNVGFGGMILYNFNIEKIIQEEFHPQTTVYFINVGKTDYLNDNQHLNTTYQYIQSLPDYNGKVWEYVEGWSCEFFLRNCVYRNNLTRFRLIPDSIYRSLLNFIKTNQIHDGSHKNIMVNGICHFQHSDQPILEI